MKNVALKTILASGVLLAASGVQADENGWTGNASLGYLASSGNTETSSLSAGLQLGLTDGAWGYGFKAAAYSATAEDSNGDDERNAENYSADLKARYSFTKHDYVFAALGYYKDSFGGVNQRLIEGVGYGRRLIDLKKHTLDGEVGAGARQEEKQDGEKNSEFVGLLNGAYKWQFSETANFTQNIRIEIGSDNTYGESVSAVNAQLNDVLSLGVSYTVKHNSTVDAGLSHSDNYTAITLNYLIK